MSRATEFQGDEVSKILELQAQRQCFSEISAIINRSKKYIYRILLHDCEYKENCRY